uniref:Uncharacterized protein n=1 Tax=Rhizophora mucronata TaxID=61149 RepID=A0A2P2QY65_RHIMU
MAFITSFVLTLLFPFMTVWKCPA